MQLLKLKFLKQLQVLRLICIGIEGHSWLNKQPTNELAPIDFYWEMEPTTLMNYHHIKPILQVIMIGHKWRGKFHAWVPLALMQRFSSQHQTLANHRSSLEGGEGRDENEGKSYDLILFPLKETTLRSLSHICQRLSPSQTIA
jgi:hypothetical protein